MNMNNNSEDYDDMDNERSFNKRYTHLEVLILEVCKICNTHNFDRLFRSRC